ncbi:hypothetical protein [Holzapfeliella floricola]|uniref:hypothetical protein n=1 Tax=Holzapfeliella floricola TaxID=679249 RepID=UPI000783AEE9|nr:hypothetical protein [Holzapfeliella floricola]
MVSVTQRIKQVKQPYGGYIKPKLFSTIQLGDNKELSASENISASLVGLVVDYMTRFQNGSSIEQAFSISLRGAQLISESEYQKALNLATNIQGLDDNSIISAAQLVGYDVIFRAGPLHFTPVETINPDKDTIFNIQTMINRSLEFIKQYGPIIIDGFTFIGGYTSTVSTGDGDFLTTDTLWDFKVTKSKLTSKQTLQLAMYYLMGKHAIDDIFDSITQIGIFNPRLNIAYILDMTTLPTEVLSEIETTVIGY